MNQPTIRRRTFCAAILAGAAPFALAQQDRYPSKPIRLLVPFSAGSLMDVLARACGERLSRRISQPVVIENKPGAGGIAASRTLLSLPEDGHQALCISSAHSVNPLLQQLPYDTVRDFSGLVLMGTSPSGAVVNHGHPAKDLGQLISMARQKSEAISFGSAGMASGTHLAGEYLAQEVGARFLHVPFKGAQEAVYEVLAGRLDVAFPAMGVVIQMVKSGQLRALGVTSARRAPQLPDVPTYAEAGVRDFDYGITFGTVVSSKAPRDKVKQLAAHMQAVIGHPEMARQLDTLGLIPSGIALDEFDQYLASEATKLARIIRNGKFS